MGNRIKNGFIVIMLPVFVYLFFYIIEPQRFGNLQGLYIMIQQSFIPSIIAWGLCFVLTLGLFDLSIGGIIIFSGIIGTYAANAVGPNLFGYIVLIITTIGIALLLETVNGVAFIALKIPSMIVTIGLLMLYETFGNLYKGGSGAILTEHLSLLGKPPYNIIFGLVTMVLAYILFNSTSWGLKIRAVGSSEIIARYSGINVNMVKIIGFILCGLFIGLASVATVSYGGIIMPQSRLDSLMRIFPPLMGYFIGIALSKYCNLIIGVFIGEFVLTLIATGMITIGIPTTLQQVVTGIFLLIVVGIAKRGRYGELVK